MEIKRIVRHLYHIYMDGAVSLVKLLGLHHSQYIRKFLHYPHLALLLIHTYKCHRLRLLHPPSLEGAMFRLVIVS